MYIAVKLQVNPRIVNKKAYNLITRCSNPLYTHTKPCRLLWKCVDHFNAKVDSLEYSIKQLGNEEKYDEDLCDPDHAHTEACRIYYD